MKKVTLLLLFTLIFFPISAQEYNTDQLLTISEIWGECYLFHPSVVRADREVNWEEALLEFLPELKQVYSNRGFMDLINLNLLSHLQDPLTLVQRFSDTEKVKDEDFTKSNLFDYILISENILSDLRGLIYLDSLIIDKKSDKPLVLDCRISSELDLDRHNYTPFHYFISMFIKEQIPISMSLSREHFGWDEYNDWWFYEQQWKVIQDDKQQKNNGVLKPFLSYKQNFEQHLPGLNFNNFVPIERPLYLIVNRSFLSYYYSLLQSLQLAGDNVFLIFENSGNVFSAYNSIRSYNFDDFEFILNPSVYINKGIDILDYEIYCSSLSADKLNNYFMDDPKESFSKSQFSFQIAPPQYTSNNSDLSVEEKILGIIKVWTIVKYFYPYIDNCSIDWKNSLAKYLELAQKTKSDHDYYFLIKEMMSTLKDSHVSTYHSSILDFSKIFIVPIKFEWIENKVIISAVDSSLSGLLKVGDEIVSINDKTIREILIEEAKYVSSSNRQGLLATIINPGYFVGPDNSIMKFSINNGKTNRIIELPRTMHVFEFMSMGDNRPGSKILDNNIGYINLAASSIANNLELELDKMKSTKSLILDLRNSYPSADYQKFLRMLCPKPTLSRQSKVPVVSAGKHKVWNFEKTQIEPDSLFSYNKPIIVLIDKSMISRPEDIAISLKSFKNVSFVGEQTQGCDGEITKIHLPGGGETTFTGQVISFGNGELFQYKGIIPDIEVKRTVGGIKNKTDEILEMAIEILSKN